MTTIEISLPDEMWASIETQMACEGHASASERIRALIREDQKRQARWDLEAKLLEGLESGLETPMTPEDWAALRA